MAKASKSLRSALAATRSYGKALGKEANADYKVGLSASLAGQLGLAKQTRAFSRDLMMGQNKNNVMLQKLEQRAMASKAQVQRGIAGTTSRYGAALGASVASQFAPATATAKSNAMIQQGYTAMGKRTTAEAQTVLATARAGVKAQGAAAQYALSQALQQRHIADNAVVGQMQADLYKTQMAADLQWQEFKREQDYAKKQADDASKPIVERLINEGSDIAMGAAEAWREADADGKVDEMEIGTLAAEWATSQGYEQGGAEQQVFAATLRNLQADPKANTPQAFNTAINTLYGGLPGFDKWGDSALNAAGLKITSATNTAWANYYSELAGGNGFGMGDEDVNAALGIAEDKYGAGGARLINPNL